MSASVTCSACARANPAGAKFCNECGAPLAHAAGQEVRKTLTILFADLVGFTSLGERLDQESLRRVMDRFYEEMRGAVHAHEGTVAKFIGDAVMAVWGTPVVREDDALRAVRAADDMRGALAVLNEDLQRRWGVRVGMRTGVNTGEVVVDPTKPADLLVGDTLNVAARLEQAAADGEVLVGPETFRLVRDEVTLAAVEPLRLKGKARRLEAYRLVDAARAEQPRAERLQAPLVGREAELARLRAAFDDAVRAGETRVVTVIGSPGVGKTRLVAELGRALEADAQLLRGHCEPATEGATFRPVAEVVRAAGGVGALPGEEDPRVATALTALLGEAGPVTAEETFWAVRRFLERLAREKPVVVVFDDVHWGEPTFLDLVEHLADWGRDAPVLVVALARPELRDLRPALAEGCVGLAPLAPDASRALVDGLLGAADLPAPLAARLLEAADGNPLFLGEMLRMLVDDGVLRRDGDTWVVSGAEEVSVPPTIQALLAARIERLPAAERRVAQHAAVIGPKFSLAAVAELAGGDDVDVHLDALRRKELVVALGDDAFRFGHALIRDAAYRPLLKEARAELHERVAAWLEGRGTEQHELAGFHLERAYGYRQELGPLDEEARALGRRAGERLADAGRRALAREDLPAAAGLLTRALTVIEDDEPARSGVLRDLAEALLSAGDTARAGDVVEELGLRAGDDPALRAHATVFAGQLANLVGAGGVRETIVQLRDAATTLAAADDAVGEAKAQHVIAGAHALLGEVAAAEAALDRALVAARAAGDQRRVTAVLSGAPRAALWGPSPVVRASGRCLDVVRIVRMTPGNRHVETMALRCQAVLEAMRGRAEAARSILRDGRASLEELGLTLELHELDVHSGIVELLAGDPAAAERHLRPARDGFAALGVETGAAQASALLARAVLAQGRDDEAIALTEAAEHHGGEDLKTAIAWRGVRAEALARGGAHGDAVRLAREAVGLAEPTDALADKADALMALAEVLRAAGADDEARDAADRARELYAAKQHEVGVARAAPGDAEAVVASDEPETAAPGESEAERVGVVWVERINAGDFRALRELYAEDVRAIDRRPTGADMEGVDTILASLQNSYDLAPDQTWHLARILAVDGGVVAAVIEVRIASIAGGGGSALAFGQVLTIEDGRMQTIELFEPDDDAAMLARFEELRAERDPVRLAPGVDPDHPLVAVARRQCQAYNRRDWDAYRDLFAPTYLGEDRRQIGWERLDRDRLLAFMPTGPAMAPDLEETTEILAVEGRVAARIHTYAGHFSDGGGPGEVRLAIVDVVDDDLRRARAEFFDPDDRAAVLARFDEVVVEEAASPAGRAMAEYLRGYNARDWAAMRDVLTDDCVIVDRRSVAMWEVDGPVDFVRQFRDAADVSPDVRSRFEQLEADDDVLAGRYVWTGTYEAGAHAELKAGLVATVRDGRVARVEWFEPDDEGAIRARFEELRPAALEPGERVSVEFVRLVNARDWDGLEALFADDVTFESYLRISLWRYDSVRELVDQLRQLDGVIGDLRAEAETLAASGGVYAGRHTWSGTHGDGTVEIGNAFVASTRDRRIVTIAVFEPDDEAAVLARFEELCAERPATGPERVLAEYLRCFNAHDWQALRAIYTNDFTLVDHRRPALWEIDGPDDLVHQLASAVDQGFVSTSRIETIAVEGDAIAIRQTGVLGEGKARSEYAFGQVIAIRDSRVASLDMFDPEDDEAMLARLAELAPAVTVAPGVDPEHPMVELLRRQADAVNRRDWAALAALCAPDYRGIDHRALGWEDLVGPEGLIQLLRSSTGRSDARISGEITAVADGLSIRLHSVAGHAVDGGGRFEARMGAITVARDGLVVREEFFAPEAREAMEARFEELRAESAPAVAARRRFTAAFESRSWEALRALYAADAATFDRRPLGFGAAHGPDAILSLATGLAAVGADRWNSQPITARGRLALFAERVAAGADAAQDFMTLLQVDADGAIWRTENFPVAEEAAARARFAELAAFDAVNTALLDAIAREDWEGIAKMISPDGVLEHHPTGTRFTGPEQMVEQVRVAAAPTEGFSGTIDRLDVAGSVCRRRELWRGVDRRTGAAWEFSMEHVQTVDDEGRMLRGEAFAAGDPRVEEAFARLVAAAPSANLATAARARFVEAFDARDWAALRALHAEDTVAVDHRPLGFGEVHGVDDRIQLIRGIADLGEGRWRSQPIAVGGRRLALFADEVGAIDPPSSVATRSLIQTDADGLVWRGEVFPDEEEAAARERLAVLIELDAWNAEQLDALVRRDWERFAATLAAEIVYEYRPVQQRFAGHEEVLAYFRSVLPPGASVSFEIDRVDFAAPGVRTRRELSHGRDAKTGAEWDYAVETLFTVDDAGRARRVEALTYGDPRRDEAIARLVAQAATPPA